MIISIVIFCSSLNGFCWIEETTQGARGDPAVAVYSTAAKVSVVFLPVGNFFFCHLTSSISHWHLFTLLSCGCLIHPSLCLKLLGWQASTVLQNSVTIVVFSAFVYWLLPYFCFPSCHDQPVAFYIVSSLCFPILSLLS